MYYRARYYDASIGRFISADPIGFIGGINFYAYCLNDPINLIDPDGLNTITIGGGIGFSIGGPPGAMIGVGIGVGIWLWSKMTDNNNDSTEGDSCPVDNNSPPEGDDSLDDYPADPDDWNPPDGWEETKAGEKTGGKHRQ